MRLCIIVVSVVFVFISSFPCLNASEDTSQDKQNENYDRQIYYGDSLPYLFQETLHKNDDNRKIAYDTIIKKFHRDPNAIPIILRGIYDSNRMIAYNCALQLGNYKIQQAVGPLWACCLDQSLNEEIKYAAAKSLAKLGDEHIYMMLCGGLGSNNPRVRSLCNQGVKILSGRNPTNFGYKDPLEGAAWMPALTLPTRGCLEDAQVKAERWQAIVEYLEWLRAEKEHLYNKKFPQKQDPIGLWFDPGSKTYDLCNIHRMGDHYYFQRKSSHQQVKFAWLQEVPTSKDRRFRTINTVLNDEYYIIDSVGDLRFVNREGVIWTAKKYQFQRSQYYFHYDPLDESGNESGVRIHILGKPHMLIYTLTGKLQTHKHRLGLYHLAKDNNAYTEKDKTLEQRFNHLYEMSGDFVKPLALFYNPSKKDSNGRIRINFAFRDEYKPDLRVRFVVDLWDLNGSLLNSWESREFSDIRYEEKPGYIVRGRNRKVLDVYGESMTVDKAFAGRVEKIVITFENITPDESRN